MDATTRPASMADVWRLREIEVDAGELFRAIGLDRIADDEPPTLHLLGSHVRSGTAWVAELDGSVVGYATASVVDHEGHLDQVSILRAVARRGIGAQLVAEVCRWAKACGFESVTLTTFRDVQWNGPYYRRLGFRALRDDECGPRLRSKRLSETSAGIEVRPRVAMRKRI